MKKINLFLLTIIFFNNIFCSNVIPGSDLYPKEIEYVENRTPFVNAAIKLIANQNLETEEVEDMEITTFPRISLCFSGGSYRSMIASLGFMAGAEQNNLLHAATYMSALSGSCWLLIPLLNMNCETVFYKRILEKKVNKNFFDKETLNIDSIKSFLSETGQNKLIDFWSASLAHHLLGDIAPNLTFEKIRKNLKTLNQYPFPIFNCVIANSKDPQDDLPYNFLEITPYTTYSKVLDSTIKTKYLGNVFKNGNQKTYNPELPESFFMGFLGSPFCLSGGDLLNFLLLELGEFWHIDDYRYLNWFEQKFYNLKLYKHRICPAKIPNYSLGLKQSKLRQTKNLELVDGGFCFNLPAEPLFRRNTDIIIFFDASVDATTPNYPELQLVANYAKEHNITFPNIKTPYQESENLKIFFDPENPDSPIIIYFTNPITKPTLKLRYDPKEFRTLYDATEQLVLENTQNIAKAISWKIAQLN